jgi:hypothetical protein
LSRFKRSTIVAFVALMLASMLTVVLSTPAQAYRTGKKCISYRDIVTCVEPDWRLQTDGNGATVEGYWVDTTTGCGSLEANDGRYNEAQAFMAHPAGSTIRVGNFGEEPCNIYHDLEWTGPDTGGLDFRVNMKARINNAGDRYLYWGFRLKPGGDYDLEYAFDTDA